MTVKGHHAHLLGRTIYTNGVGIDLLCLLYGFPTTSESGQAEARYPAFLLCRKLKRDEQSVSGCQRAIIQITEEAVCFSILSSFLYSYQ